MRARRALAGGAVAATLVFTSCAPQPDSIASTPRAATAAAPTYTPPGLTDQEQPTSVPYTPAFENVAGQRVVEPVDHGPMTYATGEAELNADGMPVAYTVAPGDIFEFIAERFGLDAAYLVSINGVRRLDMRVFVGDTINLDAHTILTVGTWNGQVFDFAPPSPMPDQQ